MLQNWCPVGQTLQHALTSDRGGQWKQALSLYNEVEHRLETGEGCRHPLSIYMDNLDRPTHVTMGFIRFRRILLERRLGALDQATFKKRYQDFEHPDRIGVGFTGRAFLDNFALSGGVKEYGEICSKLLQRHIEIIEDDMLIPHFVPGLDFDQQITPQDLCYPHGWTRKRR